MFLNILLIYPTEAFVRSDYCFFGWQIVHVYGIRFKNSNAQIVLYRVLNRWGGSKNLGHRMFRAHFEMASLRKCPLRPFLSQAVYQFEDKQLIVYLPDFLDSYGEIVFAT